MVNAYTFNSTHFLIVNARFVDSRPIISSFASRVTPYKNIVHPQSSSSILPPGKQTFGFLQCPARPLMESASKTHVPPKTSLYLPNHLQKPERSRFH